MQVIGVVGSLRAKSFNRGLMGAAREVAPAGMRITEFDIREIPPFDQDLEALGDPASVAAFKQAISAADALLVATPEYNFGVPGALKNALDWASRPPRRSPLDRKPVAIMGASMGMTGTARAQLALRQTFLFTNSPVVIQPEVLVTRAQEKFDEQGVLLDEPTRQHMRQLLDALAELVELYARR